MMGCKAVSVGVCHYSLENHRQGTLHWFALLKGSANLNVKKGRLWLLEFMTRNI